MISGVRALMSVHPQLTEFAELCGQGGAMDSLGYFLNIPHLGTQESTGTREEGGAFSSLIARRRSKVPQLMLKVGNSGLEGAILLLEYRPFGLPTGLLIPMDRDGYRTVLAPMGKRDETARRAGEVLLDRGARMVLISYLLNSEADCVDAAVAFSDCPRLHAVRAREVRNTLPLAATFEATLSAMGKHTRRDLRASIRSAVKEHGAEYVRNAELSLCEFMALNRLSMYAVPDWVARWRYLSVRNLDGGIFAGLRAANGAWLSVLGGHRQGNRVRLDWQVNLLGFGSISLVTTMRAFFLNEQIAAGMGRMRFEGGTPHSMSSAFLKESSRDLLFLKDGLGNGLLRRMATALSAAGPLAQALTADDMFWR